MKVISPIFSSMRGKLGGAVGAVSRGGVAYFRSLIIPGNPRSFAQSRMRLIQTAIAASWASTLTDLQRAAWAAISPPTSSGIDSYVKANAQVLLTGNPTVDDAPASLALVTVPYAALSVDASAHTVILPAIAAPAGVYTNVYISRPQNSSRLSQQYGFTFVGTILDASAGGVATMGPTHPAYDLVAGDIVYVRVVQFGEPGAANEGQIATEQIFRVVVVA